MAGERLGVRQAVLAAASGAALTAAVVVALALVVVPLALHATPYTVLTSSMAPARPPGSVVVTRPTSPQDIAIGDVITYQLVSDQPAVVTHRVVGVGVGSDGERTFITRGDANDVDDDPVLAVQVRGSEVYHLPYLGYLNTYVGARRPGWVLRVVSGALVLYGTYLLVTGLRERRKRVEPATVP